MAISPAPESILGVAAFTRLIRDTLTEAFPAVWVKGEITGLRRPGSGHVYFALKEKDAVLNCMMWRTSAMRLDFELRDGLAVEAFGGISVYEPRGSYQLTVETMRPGGLGALLLALEELKRKLAAEGLFDAGRKQVIPTYPRRIGLVTSPVGAAVRDLVKVLRARWPGIEIVLAPVRVQGPGAAEEIAAAIDRFNRYGQVDVLIVGRGGGSLEDLWAFNEEVVARAIAASRLPLISAVGHEVDTTLADLVADVRAATPSNAAEIAVRNRADVVRHLGQVRMRLGRAVHRAVETRRHRLMNLTGKYGFKRQRDLIGVWQQRLDIATERMKAALLGELRAARERLAALRGSYGLREWRQVIETRRDEATALCERLRDAGVELVLTQRRRLEGCEARLRALSPRGVMDRGYCLVRAADGRLLRSAEELGAGDDLTIEFSRGEADARVTAVRGGGETDGT